MFCCYLAHMHTILLYAASQSVGILVTPSYDRPLLDSCVELWYSSSACSHYTSIFTDGLLVKKKKKFVVAIGFFLLMFVGKKFSPTLCFLFTHPRADFHLFLFHSILKFRLWVLRRQLHSIWGRSCCVWQRLLVQHWPASGGVGMMNCICTLL